MAADLKGEILKEAGRGDEIAVAERMKAAAVALASGVDGLDEEVPEAGERLPQVLAATSDAGEAFLAVSFPALEYEPRGAGASVASRRPRDECWAHRPGGNASRGLGHARQSGLGAGSVRAQL